MSRRMPTREESFAAAREWLELAAEIADRQAADRAQDAPYRSTERLAG